MMRANIPTINMPAAIRQNVVVLDLEYLIFSEIFISHALATKNQIPNIIFAQTNNITNKTMGLSPSNMAHAK